MRNLQKEKLSSHTDARKYKLHWHDRIQEVPEDKDVFTMVVAHEFFDALPIHLFEKRAQNQGFREVFVDVDTSISTDISEKDKPRLRYVVSPSATLASRLLLPEEDKQLKELSDGARVEICPEAYEIAANAAKLVGTKGAGLIIDYGGEQIFGNSFRVSGST
jgi:NADH dehydrogenase [ubiquinone] 1 alpha subcomplex assembly factor 7